MLTPLLTLTLVIVSDDRVQSTVSEQKGYSLKPLRISLALSSSEDISEPVVSLVVGAPHTEDPTAARC